MKSIFYFLASIVLAGCASKEPKLNDYSIQPVNIQHVKLTDEFWLPRIKTIQNTTIPYAFDKCQKEGRMENFLIAGKKMEGKVRGKMPFDDTDIYKIIEGASYSLISNPNPVLDAYLDSIISIIKIGQEPDGYITTWITIDPAKSPAEWAKPAGERWKGEITSHELYNCGHLFEAAVAHYQATGKRNFLDIALKNADLLVKTFGPGKLSIPPGHQIVETGLVKLYRATGNKKYLELAKFYLDCRGDSTTHHLYGAYNQDHIPVIKQDETVGHAVRAIYMYAGMTDIAAIYHDSAYLSAVNRLWDNMVNRKMYVTGGIGSRHEGEAFGENYELPNLTAYNETCAAIGSVYWSHRLFMLSGNSKYYDIIERALYNGLIAGISLDGNKFFYPNPLEADGHYAFNMGACTRQGWFDCSCCPTNLIRFLPSVSGLIYATNQDSLYVNLYMSNKADILVNGKNISVMQESNYPWDGNIRMKINPAKKEKFTVKLRIPGWARNEAVPGNLYKYSDQQSANNIILKVNGKEEKPVYDKGYAVITREWNAKDMIEITLPMNIRRVAANDNVKEDRSMFALERGPLVYCAEATDQALPLSQFAISDNTKFEIEQRKDLLCGINIIKGADVVKNQSNDKGNLVLIPYYAWSNRGIGEMKVWFPKDSVAEVLPKKNIKK